MPFMFLIIWQNSIFTQLIKQLHLMISNNYILLGLYFNNYFAICLPFFPFSWDKNMCKKHSSQHKFPWGDQCQKYYMWCLLWQKLNQCAGFKVCLSRGFTQSFSYLQLFRSYIFNFLNIMHKLILDEDSHIVPFTSTTVLFVLKSKGS